MLVWSRAEPHRIGERLLVDDQARSFGRSDELGCLRWVRARGGTVELRPPSSSPNLSRDQLRLRAHGDGVHLQRSGRRRVRVDGDEVDDAVVRPGSRIEIDGELLLVVEGRWPGGAPQPVDLGFGGPDRDGLIGESAAMSALREAIARVGAPPGHVQIVGPTGSGRRRIARAIHRGAPPSWPLLDDPERPLTASDVMLAGDAAAPWLARTDLRVLAIGGPPDLPVRHRVRAPGLDERRVDIPLLTRHILLEWSLSDGRAMARHLDERGEPMVSLALIEHLLLRDYARHEDELRELLWRSVDTAPSGRLTVPSAATNVRAAAWEVDLEFDDEDDD